MTEIANRIDRLPDTLAPLKAKALQYLKYPSNVDTGGILQIGHRPWVAELNYMITLYPGLVREDIARYPVRRGFLEIPTVYSDFLTHVNGGFFFGISLCGIPPSMLSEPPLLDRSVLQCHDIGSANLDWISEYRVSEGLFHFGGRHFSFTENVGYFLDDSDRILSFRSSGECIGQWNYFSDFLEAELAASEALEEEINPSQWKG